MSIKDNKDCRCSRRARWSWGGRTGSLAASRGSGCRRPHRVIESRTGARPITESSHADGSRDRWTCARRVLLVCPPFHDATLSSLSTARLATYLRQQGVESLSTRLLGLLRKGSKAIQNLAALKWCREQGVTVAWNMLCGIPGERVEDYEEQIALMAKIPQLPPPEQARPVAVDRFSPYFDG